MHVLEVKHYCFLTKGKTQKRKSFLRHLYNKSLAGHGYTIHLGYFTLKGHCHWSTSSHHFKPLVPNAPFLYPLNVFWYFQGVVTGCTGNKWVKHSIFLIFPVFYLSKKVTRNGDFLRIILDITQPAITWSKLTIETLESKCRLGNASWKPC